MSGLLVAGRRLRRASEVEQMISRRQFGDISAIHAKNDLGVLALQFSAGRSSQIDSVWGVIGHRKRVTDGVGLLGFPK